jgi:SAM-dependent methyltransferase
VTFGATPTPLDDELRRVLVEVARAHRLPTVAEPHRLGPLVAKLAAAYNDPALRGLAGVDHRAARLGFFYARDVPKMAGAAREAIALDRPRGSVGRALRVLDLGAGLGATHRGFARALDAAGIARGIDVVAVDGDARALDLAREITLRRPREGKVAVRLVTQTGDVRARDLADRERYDVILLGNVLTELDLDRTPEQRVEIHRAMLASLLRDRLKDDGILVVVEPALRLRSRHLQRVRGALIDRGEARVLAPCLHEGRCPLLGRESDWCHEDLPVDLPSWLVPIAREAELRWEGLTFSYLVLVSSPPTLRTALASRVKGKVQRAVSPALVTKGKVEVMLCGDALRGAPEGDPYGDFGVRSGRLDREKSPKNKAISSLVRGDIVDVRGPLDDKQRVRAETPVLRVDE